MGTKVVMPQLGESVVEGTISKWLKQEGDSVEEYEPIMEVSTDKVDTEVSAPAAGTLLKIYIPEGETVQAGTLLAFIGEPGEAIPEPEAPIGVHAAPAPAPAAANPTGGTDGTLAQVRPDGNGTSPHVTPVVARIAAEHNIDVRQIPGTGRGGRVTKKDILAFIEQGGPAAPAPAEAAAPPWETPGSGDLFKPTEEIYAATSGTPAPAPTPPPGAAPVGLPGELIPLTNMRRRIADHMVDSALRKAPHVSTVFEVDMSAVVAHRAANKEAFAQQGANLTYTAYIVAACSAALRAYPMVNSSWTDEGILLKPEVNIGVAAATDAGLIVPVVKGVDSLSLLGIARAVNDLAARARVSQLKPDDVYGGTFTISNHGVSGSLFATPIINQPQAAVMGVGMVQKRAVVVTDAAGNDAIAIRPMMYIGLSFDHRIIDGAVADYFLAHVKETLENWQ
jgi:2-oxoglutarate dehydrogenase E2 component (dihydrolipoamide succinyltransferase)